MSIILCCGHALEDFTDGVPLKTKDYYIDYDSESIKRAFSFGVYCKTCAAQYEGWGLILHNEQEETDWLFGKMPDITV